MNLIRKEDYVQPYRIEPKMRRLLGRFKGSYLAVFEFVQRRKLAEDERNILAVMLAEGRELDLSREDFIRLHPRLTAHMICHSLGYCSPISAAMIIMDASAGRPNNCEWLDACYKRNAVQCLKDCIRSRHGNKGYMASYPQARAIVDRVLAGGKHPEFGSWF